MESKGERLRESCEPDKGEDVKGKTNGRKLREKC